MARSCPQVDRLVAALLLVTSSGCGEDGGSTEPPLPTTGSIRVQASTTGLGLDEDGYTVRLGQDAASVSSNGTTVIDGLSPGDHTLVLEGVGDNCDLTSGSTTAAVVAGDTSVVEIVVQCVIDLRGRLVISSEAYGLPQLVALRPDGTQRYRLFADGFSNGSPAVFPDGSRVVFVSHRTGSPRLHVFATSTGAITMLPAVGDMQFSPAVSPDGTRIAFDVLVTDADDRSTSRIWVMGADGSSPTAVTTGGPDELSDHGPSWSPDGEWIVFSRTGTLAQVRMDGSSLALLDCRVGPCGHPVWSPVGSKLAYTGLSDDDGDGVGENYDIYVQDYGTTGSMTRLTISPDQESNPTWSPDGATLAYLRVVAGNIQVFRMQADGTDQVNLTNRPRSEGPATWGPAE